jgi:lysophospholipase L1-like esterase
MKTLLCYGDSNTWGYEPGTGRRYGRSERWPGILQAALGGGYHVVEEGLKGRTTVLDDPSRQAKNGLAYLRPCLDSHAPLDLLVLMLGTNDLKPRFGLSAYDVAVNVALLLHAVKQGGYLSDGSSPPVLLVSPPHVGPMTALGDLYAGAAEKSRQLAPHYRAVAEQAGCHFLDAAGVVTPSRADGVHLDADQHARLGARVAEAVRSIL